MSQGEKKKKRTGSGPCSVMLSTEGTSPVNTTHAHTVSRSLLLHRNQPIALDRLSPMKLERSITIVAALSRESREARLEPTHIHA